MLPKPADHERFINDAVIRAHDDANAAGYTPESVKWLRDCINARIVTQHYIRERIGRNLAGNAETVLQMGWLLGKMRSATDDSLESTWAI